MLYTFPSNKATDCRLASSNQKKSKWRSILTFFLLSSCFFYQLIDVTLQAENNSAHARVPETLSVFPISVQSGRVTKSFVQGKHLNESYGVWFNNRGITAKIVGIKKFELIEKSGLRGKKKLVEGQRVTLDLAVKSGVEPGKYSFRMVSPSGISNSLPLLVVEQPLIIEENKSHNKPVNAQLITPPALINGSLSQMGEIDYYAFRVSKGQVFSFQAFSNTVVSKFDGVQLTLYEKSGSWFEPMRPNRLAFSTDANITHRFKNSGQYFVAVSSSLGIGSEQFFYQLEVKDNKNQIVLPTVSIVDQPSPLTELQKPFQRILNLDRLYQLGSRNVLNKYKQSNEAVNNGSRNDLNEPIKNWVQPSEENLNKVPFIEIEPNDTSEQALELTVPFLLEGSIERPGDLDLFKFWVKEKNRLAFELETPQTSPPYFNPHLSVLDKFGKEVFTNYFKKIAGDGDDWVKLIQAKTIYTFEEEGFYTLQVRDITPRFGEPKFSYRLLVRPQIPHVGKIEVAPNTLNLRQGETATLTVVTAQEEEFSGEVLFKLNNLPKGIQMFPGAEVEPATLPPLPELNKDRFVVKHQKTTLIVTADTDSPITQMPTISHLTAIPINQGQMGKPINVGKVLIMILKGQQ
jgi:hypothetical protein